FHEHRVLCALDSGQRMVERDHRRMDPRLDPAGVPLRVRDQLDRVSELARVPEIDGLDAVYPLAVDLAWPDLDLVGDGGEDRKFVRRVEAADIVGRGGLGVTGFLRPPPRLRHGQGGGSPGAESVLVAAVTCAGEA